MFSRVLGRAALLAALSACTPATSPVPEPHAPAPSGSVVASTQPSGSGAVGTDSLPPKSPVEVSFRDFHARRFDLAGQQITVRGRVLFKLTCPPPSNGYSPPCTASAYLAEPQARELNETAVALHRNQAGIGCQAYTTANLSCAGLRHDALYRVTAIPIKSFEQIALTVIDISLE